jgi:hypothetical protein
MPVVPLVFVAPPPDPDPPVPAGSVVTEQLQLPMPTTATNDSSIQKILVLIEDYSVQRLCPLKFADHGTLSRQLLAVMP